MRPRPSGPASQPIGRAPRRHRASCTRNESASVSARDAGSPPRTTEYERRVDRTVADANPHVEGVSGQTDPLTDRHRLATVNRLLSHHRRQPTVGDHQTVGTSDHQPAHSRHVTDELHHARHHRRHGQTCSSRHHHTPMTCAEATRRLTKGNHDAHPTTGREQHWQWRRQPRRSTRWTECQTTPDAVSRERRCSTALVWICDTRLSVTPSTDPISASVRPSS